MKAYLLHTVSTPDDTRLTLQFLRKTWELNIYLGMMKGTAFCLGYHLGATVNDWVMSLHDQAQLSSTHGLCLSSGSVPHEPYRPQKFWTGAQLPERGFKLDLSWQGWGWG